MEIKIKLNDSIKGFEYTGEFRVPNENEWCLINGMPMRRVHLALTDGDFVLEDSEGDNITLNYIAEFPILSKIKPKREFKDGAFYPVLTKHYERNRLVLMFQRVDDVFYADGCDDFKLSELEWIGEEMFKEVTLGVWRLCESTKDADKIIAELNSPEAIPLR